MTRASRPPQKIAKESGRVYVHAFHDPAVIAGQGTIAIEILNELPDVDYVVSSIGGGGLCAGLGIALKALKPEVKLVACQSKGASSMAQSLQKKLVTQAPSGHTFADGNSR